MKAKTTKIDMPNNQQLENIVLGSILIDSTALDRVIADFSYTLFHEPKNICIALAILSLYKKNQPLDLLTLVNELKSTDKLEDAGGIVYISNVTNGIGSATNLIYHIRLLQEESLRRKLITIGMKATSKSLDLTQDVFELFNETQNSLDDALKKVVNYEIKNAGSIHEEIMLKSLEMLRTGAKSGVPTGLRLLDNVTNGWQKSDLIILAGRPAMGKTALAISMCLFPVLEQKKPVAVFSLEMSSEQLVSRIQSSLSGVNVSQIVKKKLSMDEIDTISREAIALKNAPLYIDDTPNISLLDLKGKARKLKKEQGIELIIIDYLQLMRSGVKIASREQEIAEISRGLKGLAKELSIPVIALSQLSRGVESRGDKKPMLQDLRESGQIEQDADMVLFCYRPEYYGIETYEVGSESFDATGLFMLLIAKHRNGELGEIPLSFIAQQTKVTNHDFSSNYSNNHNYKSSTFVQQESEITNSAIAANKEFDTKIETTDIFTKEDTAEEELPF
jgi:replicative DNA helicase